MNAAPVSVVCSRNTTTHYFVQGLANELKLSTDKRIAELEHNLAEKLMRPPRAIIVDQANYLSERSLSSLCYIWEQARVPIILSGTKELFELFTTSALTEGVRAQLSSRVAWHYLLPELSLAETKAIVGQILCRDATDEVVAQIFNVTGGVYRHLNMLIPRVLNLSERNKKTLQGR